jgi:IS1 transposase
VFWFRNSSSLGLVSFLGNLTKMKLSDSLRRILKALLYKALTGLEPATSAMTGQCSELQQGWLKHLTLRTRIKRLSRKTICFSKSVLMHDVVIGLFVNRFEFGLTI